MSNHKEWNRTSITKIKNLEVESIDNTQIRNRLTKTTASTYHKGTKNSICQCKDVP